MVTILIVEPDDGFRNLLTEALKNAGYHVMEASNGEEALELYEKERPDLVLMDILLQGYSGIELLKMIRIFDKETMIAILTSVSDEGMQLRAYEQQVDDYILKPVSMNLLTRKVEAMLRRTGHLMTRYLKYGSICLDTEGYRAYWNQETMELTARELDLLKTLIQNQGRVMNRNRLLDKVWGYDYTGDERIVDAHIKNLRRKIPENVITTVKGIGYTMK